MGWQFLAGLAGLLALGEEPWALLLPGGEHRFGFREPGGQGVRGRPGGGRVAVLVGRLLVQGPQRVQAAELRDVFLAGRPQLGCGRRGIGPGEDLDLGPGLVLLGPGLGQRIAGPFGLVERPGGLGGAGGGGELPVQRVEGGLGRGQRVAGAEGLGAPALPVGQPLGVPLPVLGLLKLRAERADPGLAGLGLGCGGPGQPRGPGGVGQRGGIGGGRGGVGQRGGGRGGIGQRGGVGTGGLGDAGDELPGSLLGPIDFAGSEAAAVGEPVLDLAEPVGGEQLFQQLGPLVRGGVQELRELALGQQDDLVELLGGHAHEVFDLIIGLAGPGGDGPPPYYRSPPRAGSWPARWWSRRPGASGAAARACG